MDLHHVFTIELFVYFLEGCFVFLRGNSKGKNRPLIVKSIAFALILAITVKLDIIATRSSAQLLHFQIFAFLRVCNYSMPFFVVWYKDNIIQLSLLALEHGPK